MKHSIYLYFVFLLVGCTSPEITIEDAAKRAALLAARPVLEKLFYAEAPIAPSNRGLFPIVKILPGGPFSPGKYYGNRQHFSQGKVELFPGDYVVPVMTYCMKSGGSSPLAHRYQLGKLSGHGARIIHDLNARALLRFQPEEIQAASWSIQNGVPFEEMATETKKLIEVTIPEYRDELKKSFLRNFSEKWDAVAENLGLSLFDEVSDQTLNNFGEIGQEVRTLRDFRRTLKESGGNYENLRSLVSLPGASENPGTETTTPWSQISENVYARFITTGHYLDAGALQIRVVSETRAPKSLGSSTAKIDIAGLVADPGNSGIQPLSFSALSGMLAVDTLPVSASPSLIAVVIAGILAERYVDRDAFAKAIEKFGNSARDLIQKGLHVLSKEQDALEKPIRDTGILDGATPEKEGGNRRRIYSKKGGEDALNRDFDRSPGKIIPSDPGVRVKESPNGDKIVARNRSTDGAPTLEVQPRDAGKGNKIRVEVRYR